MKCIENSMENMHTDVRLKRDNQLTLILVFQMASVCQPYNRNSNPISKEITYKVNKQINSSQ